LAVMASCVVADIASSPGGFPVQVTGSEADGGIRTPAPRPGCRTILRSRHE